MGILTIIYSITSDFSKPTIRFTIFPKNHCKVIYCRPTARLLLPNGNLAVEQR